MTLSRGNGRTELTVHVELPAHLSEESVEEWWSLGIRDGWRDTVDRLAARMARSPSAS